MDFLLRRIFLVLVVVTQQNLEVYYEEDEYTMEIISYEYGEEDQRINVTYPEPERKRFKPPPCILIDFWSC